MICQWGAFISLVPPRLRDTVDRTGREQLLELRLRLGQAVELVMIRGTIWLSETTQKEDIHFCINAASQYSPWSATGKGQGYISAQGGHRLGLCGSIVISNGKCVGMEKVTSLCIRVARDIPDLSKDLFSLPGSILLIGPPGTGKTTLLRDLIRNYSNSDLGNIAVVDEREELFPFIQNQPCFATGKRTDILSGCPKSLAINMLLRSMGPSVIAVDEITAEEDSQTLLMAGWCGVKIFATAHASEFSDLINREVYKPLMNKGLFDYLVVLQKDKSWKLERMPI